MVADARSDALTRALEQQQDRLRSFLTSVEGLCGERARRNGNVAFERECTRIAMRGFRNAEHALAVELSSGTLRIVTTDAWPLGAVDPTSDQLASIGDTSNGAVYSMLAARDRLVVRARILQRSRRHVHRSIGAEEQGTTVADRSRRPG
jgi:hypothetical protein